MRSRSGIHEADVAHSLALPGAECMTGVPYFCARVRAAFWTKLWWTPVVVCLLTVPYHLVQRFASNHYRMEESRWDHLIGFEPAWVWIYLSLYLLVLIPPWLAMSSAAIRRYVCGLLWLVPISCAAWLAWPIAGPRPDVQPGAGAVFAWLVAVDSPLNTIPSMHMELAVYSLLFARRTSEPGGGSRILFGIASLWVALIAYSCLATKQHFVVDLAAGMLVAVISDAAAWGAWRGRSVRFAEGQRALGFPNP